MRFKFEVEVEVARVQGKFATREEIAALIQEALEGADPSSYYGDGGGEYEGVEWSVNEVDVAPPPKKRRAPSTVGQAPSVAAEPSPQDASGPTA